MTTPTGGLQLEGGGTDQPEAFQWLVAHANGLEYVGWLERSRSAGGAVPRLRHGRVHQHRQGCHSVHQQLVGRGEDLEQVGYLRKHHLVRGGCRRRLADHPQQRILRPQRRSTAHLVLRVSCGQYEQRPTGLPPFEHDRRFIVQGFARRRHRRRHRHGA